MRFPDVRSGGEATVIDPEGRGPWNQLIRPNGAKPFDYLAPSAENALMDPVHASDPIRPRLAVLWTALVASVAMLAAESLIGAPGFQPLPTERPQF